MLTANIYGKTESNEVNSTINAASFYFSLEINKYDL